jgi:glycosyltransferase involved in cell wall biosynthesis
LLIIEGVASGKPIVATGGGGVPEIIQNGQTGILVPMGDVQAMADAICQLLVDPSLARAMGNRGQQRVYEHFSMERTARKIEAVYKVIMGGFHKNRPSET